MAAATGEEDPAWSALSKELAEAPGGGAALAKSMLESGRATPKELMAMAALNASKADTWTLRQRFLDFARVALETPGGGILDVVRESRMLFRTLTKDLAQDAWDCEECVLPLLSLVDCLVAGWKQNGETKAMAREASVLLLNALVDPIALRVQPPKAAQRACLYIFDAIIYEFKQATQQSLLLHQARQARDQSEGEIEDKGDTSPAEFWNEETEDSETPSSDASGVGSVLTIPPLASAASAWAMATTPGTLDFLSPSGRLAWVHEKSRVFLDRRDSLLIAWRGIETLLAVVPVDISQRNAQFRNGLCATFTSLLACAVASQSPASRDAFATIVRGIQPASSRIAILDELILRRVPPHSPARAFVADLLRVDSLEPGAQAVAERILEEEDPDLDTCCAMLNLLRVSASKRKLPVQVRGLVQDTLARLGDSEPLDKGDDLALRPPVILPSLDMKQPRPFPAPSEPSFRGDVRAGKVQLLRFAAMNVLQVCEE